MSMIGTTTKSFAQQAARLGARSLARGSPKMMWKQAPSTTMTSASATSRAFVRHSTTTTAGTTGTAIASKAPKKNLTFAQGLAGGLVLAGLHSATGSQNDFFEYRFPATSTQTADDIATFYGSEDFMELFCIFPFVGYIMMRNGEFDDKGDVSTMGCPGTLKVSMVFSEDVDKDSGEIEWFNKRERFHDTLFGYTMWDMVTNFGFRTLEDGTIECYHYGEFFHGSLPVISQIVLLVFKTHARWVAWSTEHHLHHYAFHNDTDSEEEMEEESRKNMPFFLLKHYAWSDLMAMLFGIKEDVATPDGEKKKAPSFLVRRGSAVTDEDDKLPVQLKDNRIQIRQDIASDRNSVQAMLQNAATKSSDEAKVVLARTLTLKPTKEDKPASAYSAATEAAMANHMARRASYREDMNLDLNALKQRATLQKKMTAPKDLKAAADEMKQQQKRRGSSVGASSSAP